MEYPEYPDRRHLLVALYEDAITAVRPGPLVRVAISTRHSARSERVHLFALGKAAHAMAESACSALTQAGATVAGGLVVAPTLARYAPVPPLRFLAGDHPQPGDRSLAASHHIGECVQEVRAGDTAVVLVSGGTSSLTAAPVAGISTADLHALYMILDRSGLPIRDMNAVRKRFTRWGAGRLAVALAPAPTNVFLLSDVPGDDPADIGSGPCAPDVRRGADIIEILRDAALWAEVPRAMRAHLLAVESGTIDETPKIAHPAFASVSTEVIGTNALALDAIVAGAALRGVAVQRAPDALAGDAASCGAAIAHALLARASHRTAGDAAATGLVWGGETTVARTLAGARDPRALGGRCQELALSAARVLAGAGDAGRRVALLAAGTDGRDGPTDASGGFVDGSTWAAIAAASIDPDRALRHHASYAALDAAGALLRRGPTGTNVMDLVIGVVG